MSAVAGRKPIHLGGLTDDDLVALARDGDREAFEAIVQRYRAPLFGYCRRWLDPHRAEEVVQHTLLKAFLCMRDDDRPLTLRPWLYRVAHNAALNALEKKGSDWEELDENYDGVPQPPQVAEQRARFLKVVDEIDALPDRQREALLLNEFEGRCYADIATQLGTSESGVRGLLRRARSQLREAAAALLLPIPVLRELVRVDASRGLPLDRAGEVLGSAGGIGAAGIAKVAVGVLAAGTIAGGGAAMKVKRDNHPAPKPEGVAASKPAVEPAGDARGGLGGLIASVGPAAVRAAAAPEARPERGTQPAAGVQLPSGGLHGGASPRRAAPRTIADRAPGEIRPLASLPALPPLPAVPLVPLPTAPADDPGEEEHAGGEIQQGGDSGSSAPADQRTQPGEDGAAGAGAPSEGRKGVGLLSPREA